MMPGGRFFYTDPIEHQRKAEQGVFCQQSWTTHRVVRSEAERTGVVRKAFQICTPVNAEVSDAGTQLCEEYPSAQPSGVFWVCMAVRGGGPLVLGELARKGPTHPRRLFF